MFMCYCGLCRLKYALGRARARVKMLFFYCTGHFAVYDDDDHDNGDYVGVMLWWSLTSVWSKLGASYLFYRFGRKSSNADRRPEMQVWLRSKLCLFDFYFEPVYTSLGDGGAGRRRMGGVEVKLVRSWTPPQRNVCVIWPEFGRCWGSNKLFYVFSGVPVT